MNVPENVANAMMNVKDWLRTQKGKWSPLNEDARTLVEYVDAQMKQDAQPAAPENVLDAIEIMALTYPAYIDALIDHAKIGSAAAVREAKAQRNMVVAWVHSQRDAQPADDSADFDPYANTDFTGDE